MAFETIQGTLRQTRLTNESAEYRARREALRLAEIDLMQRCERVAELRRSLPPGATAQDYVFQEGPADLNAGDSPTRSVRLSELFSGPAPWSSITSCTARSRRIPAPCAQCGSTASTASDIIWRRTSTSSSPPLPIRPPCASTPATGDGITYGCSLRHQHVQVRPAQRGRRRQPGFDHLGLHARP
jgi:Bacterial protein of unknown function (DUF899)